MENYINDTSITLSFGSNVFNDAIMRERLPKVTYKSLRRTIDEGLPLDENIAEVVANAMKDWAIEKGASHFSHWFQPMTGITAEKHDAFIAPSADGRVIMEFSGKDLIKGEPDASSFPSGGLRSTFEARGYTAWDCTSPSFIKDGTLYIPTAFCSYTGGTLDKKTPLLRSMEALSKQATRILKLLGNTCVSKVTTTVGPEQEYFLIDKNLYSKRKDLIFTGRTLFGAKPPKGQEMEDHYFGNIRERVSQYMKELDYELWKLGVSAKTKHNEVAPSQHELAPIFTTSNIATDHNQLTMEFMKKIALRHDFVCLLHEKPFAYVNGSGKHNNWSMSSNDGQNLLEPGSTPHENAQFLLFLSAVIKAVDEFSDLLRLSVASAGNDHRLGANEAPPAIVSIFLGDQLTNILLQLENGKPKGRKSDEKVEIGVTSLPKLPKDSTDRNRTSPFAFTGNKFEFRMLGSSSSIAGTNTILNTIVADVLMVFADRLEKAEDVQIEISSIIKDTIKNHKRVIFNGNNYSEEWVEEAKRRGLPNIESTVEAIPVLLEEKNVDVFERHNILRRVELESRCEILFDNYAKIINIEALTMLQMAKIQILPASIDYAKQLADTINSIKNTGLAIDVSSEASLLKELSPLIRAVTAAINDLRKATDAAIAAGNVEKQAEKFHDDVLPIMSELRSQCDKLELIVPSWNWPFPTYSELLFDF